MTAFTGQSQDPGRDPLAQRLIDVAWVHVASIYDPVGVKLEDSLNEVDEATRGAVAAVLRELATNSFGRQFPLDYLEDLASGVDRV